MRKIACFVMALALVLGLTQCKKDQNETPNLTQGMPITLTVASATNETNGDGSRVIVDPTHDGANDYASLAFEKDDQITVVCNGRYAGALSYLGNNTFFGLILYAKEGEYLDFYLLGGKGSSHHLVGTNSTGAVVDISNQSSRLPVVSYGRSAETYSDNRREYTVTLRSKVSIMKFNVTTPTDSPICLMGMNNKVTVNFDPTSNDNDGFSYSMDEQNGGKIMMKGGSGEAVEKWVIVLPQDALGEGEPGSACAANNTYTGTRPAIPAIGMNQYYPEGIAFTVNTTTNVISLGNVTTDTIIGDGITILGTLAANVKVSIADGATVTLDGVTINGANDQNCQWAGLNCLGDATLILKGTNNVKGFFGDHPAIIVPTGKTLTIQGSGSLNASSNGEAAGIGSGCNQNNCGNIVIQSGTITAIGTRYGAGIGSGRGGVCGNITINGGTIIATGGENAAAIGGGWQSTCGDITFANTIINSLAQKGSNAPNSVGAGLDGTCSSVTLGNTSYWNGSSYQNGGESYLTKSIVVYPIPAISVSSNKKVYFAPGNLTLTKSSSGSWVNGTYAFMAHQYDILENEDGVWCGFHYRGKNDMSLFGWGKWGSDFPNCTDFDGVMTTYTWTDFHATINGYSDWRTPTNDEFMYLLNSRPGHRYTQATVNTDGWPIQGLILFPDHFIDIAPAGVTWGEINRTSDFTTTCTIAGWNALEGLGCVFLPCGGSREDNYCREIGERGLYWSCTPYGDEEAYVLDFSSHKVWMEFNHDLRGSGNSVRLVRNAN